MKNVLITLVLLFVVNSVNSQNWNTVLNGENSGSLLSFLTMHGSEHFQSLFIGGKNLWNDTTYYGGIVGWNENGFYELKIGSQNVGIHGFVNDICEFENKLIVGGEISLAGSLPVHSIAAWDGSEWSELGMGVYSKTSNMVGIVRCLLPIESGIFIAGSFDSIVGSTDSCLNFAFWNGTQIIPFSGPPIFSESSSIYAMTIYNDELIIGGNFYDTQNNKFNRIAKWNGIEWLPLQNGLQGNLSIVQSLEVFNDKLYVGGYFFKDSGNKGNFIQAWNGNSWEEVGGSVAGESPFDNGQVICEKVYKGELWIGGAFYYAGGIPACRIAKWDGDKWCSVEDNFDNRTVGIETWNDELFIFGDLLGSNSPMQLLQWQGGDNVDSCSTPISIINTETYPISICPNPTTGVVNVNVPFYGDYTISVFSIDNKLVFNGAINDSILDLSGLEKGIYVLSIYGEQLNKSIKILLQ